MSPKSWVRSLFAPRTARRPVRRPARTVLAAEPLEARALMASGIGVSWVTLPSGPKIEIQGTALNDNVMVTGGDKAANFVLNVYVNNANGNESRQFNLAAGSVKPAIQFQGGDGDDFFADYAGYEHAVNVFGENGNDRITGGGWADVLAGGAGTDTLTGGGGNDLLDGGAGTDFAVRDAADPTPVNVEGWTLPTEGFLSILYANRELRLVGDDGANGATVRLANRAGTIEIKGGRIGPDDRETVIAQFAPGMLDRVYFEGLGGHDYFANDTGLPSRALGGAGNDLFLGGDGADDFEGGDGDDYLLGRNGNDMFRGGPGNDRYEGGDGQDVLDRRGQHGMFRDGGTDDTTYNSLGTKVAGRLSPAELNAVGQLNAFRVGDRVWLTGPSGAGFALRSPQWTESTAGGTVTFSTTKAVTFETSWGDIPLPATGLTFSVKGGTTPAAGVAKAPNFYLGAVPLTSAGLTNNTVGQFFQSLSGKFESGLESASGGDLTMSGVSWGIALGTGVGDDAAPLNPAVPYLYFHGQTGTSFAYENASYSNARSGTAAYAPGDGTLYFGLTGLPVLSDIAVGVSTEGYLPYEPEKIPLRASDPNIYGHLYLRGEIDFSDFDVPLALNGEIVVDLDANDDGTLGGGAFTEARMAAVIDETLSNLTKPSALLGAGSQIAADVSVGLNAGAAFSFEGLNLKLASGSFWRTPQQVAFKLSANNLFEGIPVLGSLVTTGGYTIEGWRNTDGTFAMGAELRTGSVAGMPSASMSASISSQQPVWRVNAKVTLFSLPVVGSVDVTVSGSLATDGTYGFTGNAPGVRVEVYRSRVFVPGGGWRYNTGGGIWVFGEKIASF